MEFQGPVLVVGAHPDDTEFGAGGTIAAFTGAGQEAHYIVCTDGSKGSKDRSVDPRDLVQPSPGRAARRGRRTRRGQRHVPGADRRRDGEHARRARAHRAAHPRGAPAGADHARRLAPLDAAPGPPRRGLRRHRRLRRRARPPVPARVVGGRAGAMAGPRRSGYGGRSSPTTGSIPRRRSTASWPPCATTRARSATSRRWTSGCGRRRTRSASRKAWSTPRHSSG